MSAFSPGSLARAVRGFPWLLVGTSALIVALSLVAIRSASFDGATGAHAPYAERQLAWAALGFLALAVTAVVPYDRIAARSDAFYALSIVALVLVFAIGTQANNAVRWFAVGSVRVQPSEFAKYALVLVLARAIALAGERIGTLRGLAAPVALTLVPFVLVMKQPDLGTSLTYFPILGSMVFVAGARLRHLAGAVLSVALAAPIAWRWVLHDYQRLRVRTFLNPAKSALGGAYQAIQSQIAVGSGGVFGKGFERGSQGSLGFIPERHTDFIFAVVGEEWGLLGGLLLLALYGLLFFSLLAIARETRDLEGRLIVTGVASILIAHVGVNVGMATGVAPVTGITLPLVSYGGSSLLASLFGIGLAASVARRKVVVWGGGAGVREPTERERAGWRLPERALERA